MLSYNTYLIEVEIPVLDYLLDLGPGMDDIPIVGKAFDEIGIGDNLIKSAFKAVTGSDGKLYIGVASETDLGSGEIDSRAAKIGETIGAGLAGDLVVLCEVWTEKTLDIITSSIRREGRTVTAVVGPGPGSPEFGGSGLCVLSLGPEIEKIDDHVFTRRGKKNKDTDAWASKSVMLTRVDLGPGKIDLYSTHLNWGGDIPELAFDVPKYGRVVINRDIPGAQMRTRLRQCEEIVAFIDRTHDPRNVAVLTGDFNIDGSDPAEYAQLLRILDGANLVDQWKWHFGGSVPGMTSGTFENICKLTSHSRFICDETESPPTEEGGSRYDYLFVEKPTSEHEFNLDLSLLERRPYRYSSPRAKPRYLSDHIGLYTGLIFGT